jgi:hypothetical protein
LRAHEQAAIELLLERADPRAHRRLRDVQALGRPVEVAGLGDLKKGAQMLDVHGSAIDILDQPGQQNLLSNLAHLGAAWGLNR